jgi:Ca2+-transporting ATPase
MQRRPRAAGARLFSARTVTVAVLQGLCVLLVCLLAFELNHATHGTDAARALVFAALVVSFIAIILVNRSWTRSAFAMLAEPNAAVWWVSGGTCVFLGLVLCVPAMQRLFKFAPVNGLDLTLSLLAGAACLGWFEVLKRTRWWRSAAAKRVGMIT